LAVSFFLVGLVVASGLSLPSFSVAKTDNSRSMVPVGALSSMPGSYAELVEKLNPTVANVRVTKVEQVAFQQPQIPDGPLSEFFERFFKEMPQFPENHN
jgi:hypothetical protein